MITNKGLDLWVLAGRKPAQHLAFFKDPESQREQLLALGRQIRSLSVQVLVDLAEEDFRIEQVPRLHGRDHRAIVHRHLQREFRETPYRMLCSRIPDPKASRKEHVLLSGIIVPEQVDRWLSPLIRAGCNLQGVHSVTLLGERLLRHLPASWRRDTRLIATCTRHGGLRLSLFDHGKLRFSRLTIHDGSGGGLAEFVAEELRRSRRFYENLRLLERGRELHCALFIGGECAIPASLEQEGLHVHRLSRISVGRVFPVRRTLDQPCSDAILAELLVRETPRKCYQTKEQHAEALRSRIERFAWHGASMTFAGAVGFAGISWIDRQAMEGTLKTMERSRDLLIEKVETLDSRSQGQGYSAAFMHAALLDAQRIRSHDGRTVMPVLRAVGQVLLRYPGYRLRMLGWQTQGVGRDQEADDSVEPAIAAMSHAGIGQGDAFLLLKGEVPFDAVHFLELQQRIQRMVQELSRVEGVRGAQLLQQPLDSSSERGVHGVIREAAGEMRMAPLSILLKLESS